MISVLLQLFVYKITSILDKLEITRKILFSVLTASWCHSPREWGFPGDGVPGLYETLLFPMGLRCTTGR